jgi:hypothetical protein
VFLVKQKVENDSRHNGKFILSINESCHCSDMKQLVSQFCTAETFLAHCDCDSWGLAENTRIKDAAAPVGQLA